MCGGRFGVGEPEVRTLVRVAENYVFCQTLKDCEQGDTYNADGSGRYTRGT